MGWREVLRGKWSGAVYMGLCDAEGRGRMAQADVAVAALFALPPADRIALARELLAGTGKHIAGEPSCPTYTQGCAYSARPMGAERRVGAAMLERDDA